MIGIVLLLLSVAFAQDPSIVKLPSGTLQGVARENSRYFKGIPYAAPPINDLRWRPPQPASPWSGTWDATDFRWSCPQGPFDPPITNMSEDCLYLNIYAPLPPSDPSTLFPVMFWIHGGGFTGGGGNESRANGTWEVELRKDIIIVTFDYRLNIFGFLGSSELRSRSSDNSTGNYGLQDQRFALQWVIDNIKYFNGDPKNILIYGESAGAASVTLHLTMKKSFGLYQKAIMESGAFPYWTTKSWDATESVYQNVLMKSGCSDANCLLKMNVNDLVTLYQTIPSPCKDQGPWTPAIDGVDITDYPWHSVQKGQYYKVPMIVGTQKDEQLGGIAYNGTQQDFNNFIIANWGTQYVEILNDLYPASNYQATDCCTSYWWASVQVNADYNFAAPSRRTVRWFSDVGAWYYLFTYPILCSWGPPNQPVAYHSEDLPFVFMTENLLNGTDEINFAINLAWYWTNFAHGSNPNYGGKDGQPIYNWPQYQNSSDINIQLDLTFATTTNLRKQALDFWDSQLEVFTGCRPV